MRSLQLCLHQSWDRVDQLARIPWSQYCLRDPQWWLHLTRLSQGVSLHQVSPDLDFWSDASAMGWGHIWAITPLPAFRAKTKLHSLSTPESFLRYVGGSSTSSHLWWGRRLPCSVTALRRWHTFAWRGARGLPS